VEDEKVSLLSISKRNDKWFRVVFIVLFLAAIVYYLALIFCWVCAGVPRFIPFVAESGVACVFLTYAFVEFKEGAMFFESLREAREKKLEAKGEAKAKAKTKAEIVSILTRPVSAEDKIKEIEKMVNGK
jgi:hypothetical protein